MPTVPAAPSPGPRLTTRSELGLAALVGALYLALSLAVFALIDPEATGAAWWPAAGLTLGALCRLRRVVWPWALAAVFVADVVADLLHDAPLSVSLVWATANTLEPLLGALALQRAFRGRAVRLETTEDVGRFVAVSALAGPPVASLVGALGSVVLLGDPFIPVWPRWLVGDVLGILVVAPAVLALTDIGAMLRRPRALVLLGVVAGIALVVFGAPSGVISQLPYLVVPALLALALAEGPAGAAAGGLVMAVIANVLSALGRGPFPTDADDPEALVVLQIFTAAQLLTVLVIAAQSRTLRRARGDLGAMADARLRDPLTGVGSREALDDTLAALSSPGAPPSAVFFLDLDHFKPVNDTHGHHVGDEVLRTVGRRLAGAVSARDRVGRLGGDEFLVVCPGVDERDCPGIAARLEGAVSAPMRVGGVDLRVGVSIGTVWNPGALPAPPDVVRTADRRMYARKAARR